MKELGILNRGIAKIISEQGHRDLLMVCDAGFSIPVGMEVIDVSISENKPGVVEILNELKKYFSVEKMIMANETKSVSPTLFKKISNVWSDNMEVELLDQVVFRQKSKEVKAVIRTGEFSAFGNVILVSGAGGRWYCEND
jgi:D-ribose pyranase